jgi:hypothetical protein
MMKILARQKIESVLSLNSDESNKLNDVPNDEFLLSEAIRPSNPVNRKMSAGAITGFRRNLKLV